MVRAVSRFLDRISDFLAQRKGLMLMTGILLVAVNGVLQFVPGAGWLAQTNLLLHLGIILGLLGILLAWAL